MVRVKVVVAGLVSAASLLVLIGATGSAMAQVRQQQFGQPQFEIQPFARQLRFGVQTPANPQQFSQPQFVQQRFFQRPQITQQQQFAPQQFFQRPQITQQQQRFTPQQFVQRPQISQQQQFSPQQFFQRPQITQQQQQFTQQQFVQRPQISQQQQFSPQQFFQRPRITQQQQQFTPQQFFQRPQVAPQQFTQQTGQQFGQQGLPRQAQIQPQLPPQQQFGGSQGLFGQSQPGVSQAGPARFVQNPSGGQPAGQLQFAPGAFGQINGVPTNGQPGFAPGTNGVPQYVRDGLDQNYFGGAVVPSQPVKPPLFFDTISDGQTFPSSFAQGASAPIGRTSAGRQFGPQRAFGGDLRAPQQNQFGPQQFGAVQNQ